MLSEDHIQNPMQPVFYTPMATNRTPQPPSTGTQAADELTHLNGLLCKGGRAGQHKGEAITEDPPARLR